MNIIDQYVGKQIKHRRLELGITQQNLADAIGVSFQQVQKYESAENRISASKLYEIAETLDVNINYFFMNPLVSDNLNITEKELIDIAKTFSKIKNKNIKNNLKSMVNAIIKENSTNS